MIRCDRPGCPSTLEPTESDAGWRSVEYPSDDTQVGAGPEYEGGDYKFCSWDCIALFASEKAERTRDLLYSDAWPRHVVEIRTEADKQYLDVFVEDERNGKRLFDVEHVLDLYLNDEADPHVDPKTYLVLNLNVDPAIRSAPYRGLEVLPGGGANYEFGVLAVKCRTDRYEIRGGELYPEHNRRGMEWA